MKVFFPTPSRALEGALLSVLFGAVLVACSSTTTTTPSMSDSTASNVDIKKRDGGPTDNRKRATIRLQLAVGYYQDGKYAIALDELKQALTLDPNFADAHTVLAMVYTELHQDSLAEESFQRALQLEPGNPDLNNNYGWYLCQHGREKQSLTFFENALKDPLYTQKAKPLQNAGVCANKLGDPVAAEEYFRRSFEIDPTGAVAAYNLAVIYFDRKDFPRARFYVAQVNNSPGPSAQSLWLGIRIERRLGNKTNQVALETQLERLFADSREAQMQKRGNYGD
jgi:type IV pilus assembly protein PilF